MSKWLQNIPDPYKQDAVNKHRYSPESFGNIEQQMREWHQHLKYVKENRIGRPKATSIYSVEELEAKGYMGLYKPTIYDFFDPKGKKNKGG